MDEIARLVPIYGGISYQRLEEEGGLVLRTNLESPQPTQVLYSSKEHRGIQWPCSQEDHLQHGYTVLQRIPQGQSRPYNSRVSRRPRPTKPGISGVAGARPRIASTGDADASGQREA